MKNYNDIYDQKEAAGRLLDTAYSRGYDNGYEDHGVEAESSETETRELLHNAYEQGLNDAWNVSKKIWRMVDPTRKNVFGTDNMGDIFDSYSASEVVKKLKAYEYAVAQESTVDEGSIKFGDIVYLSDDPFHETFVVTAMYTKSDTADVMDSNGRTHSFNTTELVRTGENVMSDLQLILDGLKEGTI